MILSKQEKDSNQPYQNEELVPKRGATFVEVKGLLLKNFFKTFREVLNKRRKTVKHELVPLIY